MSKLRCLDRSKVGKSEHVGARPRHWICAKVKRPAFSQDEYTSIWMGDVAKSQRSGGQVDRYPVERTFQLPAGREAVGTLANTARLRRPIGASELSNTASLTQVGPSPPSDRLLRITHSWSTPNVTFYSFPWICLRRRAATSLENVMSKSILKDEAIFKPLACALLPAEPRDATFIWDEIQIPIWTAWWFIFHRDSHRASFLGSGKIWVVSSRWCVVVSLVWWDSERLGTRLLTLPRSFITKLLGGPRSSTLQWGHRPAVAEGVRHERMRGI